MKINEDQLDILSETVHVGVGRAAAALNDMVGHKIRLSVPILEVIDAEALKALWLKKYVNPVSCVTMNFNGSFSGNAALVFPPEAASVLVSALTDEPHVSGEMDALCMGTLTEVGNIFINGVIGSIGNTLNSPMGFSLPTYIEGSAVDLVNSGQGHKGKVLVANTTFSIDDLQVIGKFVLFFEIDAFTQLLCVLDEQLAV